MGSEVPIDLLKMEGRDDLICGSLFPKQFVLKHRFWGAERESKLHKGGDFLIFYQ